MVKLKNKLMIATIWNGCQRRVTLEFGSTQECIKKKMKRQMNLRGVLNLFINLFAMKYSKTIWAARRR